MLWFPQVVLAGTAEGAVVILERNREGTMQRGRTFRLPQVNATSCKTISELQPHQCCIVTARAQCSTAAPSN